MAEVAKKNNNYNLFLLCMGILIILIFMLLFFMDRQQQHIFERKQIEMRGDIMEQIRPNADNNAANINTDANNAQNNTTSQQIL